jgi:hypothetical protein
LVIDIFFTSGVKLLYLDRCPESNPDGAKEFDEPEEVLSPHPTKAMAANIDTIKLYKNF